MEHTSPTASDEHVSEDEISGEDELDLKQEHDGSPSVASNAAGRSVPGVKPSLHHLQKRRRVTRACDECRRKKIKCDGKQPCTHCTVYSYGNSRATLASQRDRLLIETAECTYDQPSNRRRNPAPQYVEDLERRVHRAETLLHILIPNLNLRDPGIDLAVAQGWIPGAPGRGDPGAAHESRVQQEYGGSQPESSQNVARAQQGPDNNKDTNLESMVRAVAQLDVDEQGHWDYHGHSSGLSFVRRMREQLGPMMGPDTAATPFVKSRPLSMTHVLDSPRSSGDSPGGASSPGAADLPPKEYARQVCSHAVDDAAALLRFLHKPSFWQAFERLYKVQPDNYTNEDNKFLPLFHSAMALGHLFGKDDQSNLSQNGYENAIQQGFSHFKTARGLMDIADCRDLTSIQAVMFMILFLQSSAKLSQCYAYVGVALRSALRMGLHRAHVGDFNPVELETRKRVFWVVRKMDIYVGAMLGLPQTLSDEDIDQDFPAEADDEYITTGGILPMPEGVVSVMTAFNLHTRLVMLLTKIVRKVYPIKTKTGAPDKSYSVPFSTIKELESDLERWKNSLPAILTPASHGSLPERYFRIQQLLRLSYAHAQVLLYRPFLHYTRMDKRHQDMDPRAYACAISYVNVSRNIIHITSLMKQQGLLNGAFWFIMYTSFFAILSLVYYAAENPDNATAHAVMKDALEGRLTLASLSTRSMAADRCTATLNSVFKHLPDWMQEGQQNPMMSKKRPLEPSSKSQHSTYPQAARSHPDVSLRGRETPMGGAKRASTFPHNGAQVFGTSPTSYEPSWTGSGASTYGPQTPTGNNFDINSGAWNARTASGRMNGSMQSYTLPQNFANPELPDLSSMMFSTADEPFAYPNQPLTTFENNQQMTRNNPYVNSNAYSSVDNAVNGMAGPSRTRDENMEAQYFALPPYIDQKQQPQYRQQQSSMGGGFAPDAMNLSNGGSMGTSGAMNMANGDWAGQQNQQPQALSNINIQDIFGGAEWNPMMMGPGFQNH